MKKTIYNTYVKVTNQTQCTELKEICLRSNLPIWNDSTAFEFWEGNINILIFSGDFSIGSYPTESDINDLGVKKVTKQEWIRLIKTS